MSESCIVNNEVNDHFTRQISFVAYYKGKQSYIYLMFLSPLLNLTLSLWNYFWGLDGI